ncbi:hypothetical protein KCG44_07205 [Pacificimonas sp. WHA3]|uniref:DoxX family protein n=1 Tax=Pacificimonas pallii TaxID=2827236 RepID=A0ABS6SF60_9SPHN|nr:hypothetical protein [Pacificimonas pallii]MBV7256571.1 hypothetical protein [Pacificimonas pallii]
MKAITLLLLRISTGVLLMAWGVVKIGAPEASIGVSDKYYGGLVSAEMIQTPFGLAQIGVGLMVVLGLFRKVFYPLQALMLIVGALAIWKYILDPLGMYLLDENSRQLLFFPSFCVAVATVVMIAFREDDTITLDAKLGRN